MKKRNIIILVVIILITILGTTLAYITWTSNNINFGVQSGCFTINYQKGQDLSGTINPSTSYTGGLSTSVKMNISNLCTTSGRGIIYLETLDTTSNKLYREGLLNYQVLIGSTVTNIKGSITSSGVIPIDIGQLTKSSSASSVYTVYIWIDYNEVNNDDVGLKYNGRITAEAVQEG